MSHPAILLGAGEGKRLGQPKALVDLGGEPMLAFVARRCAEAGFGPIIAVVMDQHRRQAEAMQHVDVVTSNPDPASGPLRSLHLGMEHLPPDATGLLLVKIDFALVESATYMKMKMSIEKDPSKLWRPVREERHGHPVWFPQDLFSDLRSAPLNQGARTVVYAQRERWGAVEVDDPGIHRDIDHPEDLAFARQQI